MIEKKNNDCRLMGAIVFLFFLVPFVATSSAAKTGGDNMVASYRIESLFCSGCVAGIQMVVLEIDDVISAVVDLDEHTLTVEFERDVTDAELLMQRITKATGLELVFVSVEGLESDARR